MNKPNQNTLVIFAGLIGLGFVVYLIADKYLMLKAFDDCAQAARYVYEESFGTTEAGSIITSNEPKHDFYIACIKDKGYETSITK